MLSFGVGGEQLPKENEKQLDERDFLQVNDNEEGRSPSPIIHEIGPDGESTYAQVKII